MKGNLVSIIIAFGYETQSKEKEGLLLELLYNVLTSAWNKKKLALYEVARQKFQRGEAYPPSLISML